MDEELEIEVTQEDIECGERNNQDSCPVARAARRKLGRKVRVNVGSMEVSGKFGPHRPGRFYKLDEATKEFIRDFDARQLVKPFTARMEMSR
jgi:hypothetical protein